jgi:hypothetical protein
LAAPNPPASLPQLAPNPTAPPAPKLLAPTPARKLGAALGPCPLDPAKPPLDAAGALAAVLPDPKRALLDPLAFTKDDASDSGLGTVGNMAG